MDQNVQPIIVAVSGGFDPIHSGHIRMIEEAKKLGDRLVVILNNDNWLRKKKGKVFMTENERRDVIQALRAVDEVVITSHTADTNDMSVCNELRNVRPHIFANGGDRVYDNTLEIQVCNEINCRLAFGIGAGGKIQSSSWLLSNYFKS